jgi:ATP-dependent DNA helicase RecG
MPGLKVADIFRDIPILEMARKEAFDLVSRDPSLSKPEVASLRRELMKKYEGFALAVVS